MASFLSYLQAGFSRGFGVFAQHSYTIKSAVLQSSTLGPSPFNVYSNGIGDSIGNLPVSGLPKTSKSSVASVMWRLAKPLQSDIDSAHKKFLDNSMNLFIENRRLYLLHTYLPRKIEQTECSEMLAYKIQTPGNYPEESIQHSEQGESLKSGIPLFH